MVMWAIKPERDSSMPANMRGYVIAHSRKIAEFVALRNNAIVVECHGPVGTDTQRPFLVWDISSGTEPDFSLREFGLFELRPAT